MLSSPAWPPQPALPLTLLCGCCCGLLQQHLEPQATLHNHTFQCMGSEGLPQLCSLSAVLIKEVEVHAIPGGAVGKNLKRTTWKQGSHGAHCHEHVGFT